jgi:glycosyltransferase involved in cell wall biosynthesis
MRTSKHFVIFIGSLKKGGAERNAALLSNYLVSQGHAVTLILFIRDIAFDLDARVNIMMINHKRFSFAALNALYVVYKLRSIIKKINPQRLIAMSRIGSAFLSSVILKNTVVRFDIYPLTGYKKRKQWQCWILYNMPWVKYVVCPSQELLDDVRGYFINKRKLVTIYNPVPQVQQVSRESGGRPYFVVVARLHAQKNIGHVISAFHAAGLYSTMDLVIIGDGPARDELNKQVVSLGLTDHVVFKGFLKDPYPYIGGAVALINASLREGFPNVLVESLSLGTPVLSSASKTGPREIVFNGENGYLFDVGDYKKLSELMKLLVESPLVYDKLKKNVNKGLDRFSYEAVTASWENILYR